MGATKSLESEKLALKKQGSTEEESQSLNAKKNQEQESEKKNSLLSLVLNAFKDIGQKKSKNPVIEKIGRMVDWLLWALVNLVALGIKGGTGIIRKLKDQQGERNQKAIKPSQKERFDMPKAAKINSIGQKPEVDQAQQITTQRLMKRSASMPDLANAAGNTATQSLKRSASMPDLANAAGNTATQSLKRSASMPDLSNTAGSTTAKTTAVGQNAVVSQQSVTDMNRLSSIMKSAASLSQVNKAGAAPKLNAVSRKENLLKSNITAKRRHSFAL